MPPSPSAGARTAARLVRVVDGLGAAAMAVSAVAVVLMTLLITLEVVGRSFLGASTLVSDEMSGYLLVVLTFFGLADSLRSDSFIRVEFLYGRLGPGVRRRLDVALLGIALAYTGLLAYYFWEFVAASYRFGTTSIYFTRTRLWIPQAFMALGASILGAQIVGEGLRRIVAGERRG